jgi:hypothetical protein
MRLAAFLLVVPLFAQSKVNQHMMLLESTGTDLNVNETLIVNGPGKVQVAVPMDAGTPAVRGAALAPTRQPGVYELDVRGEGSELRVDLAWSMPFVVPETLSGRILHDGPVRFVFPKDVSASGKAIESNGTEPTTLASIFTLKGRSYAIEINGAGSLRAQRPAERQEDGPTIEQILPRIYGRLYWVLGLTFAILAIGFYLNFRAPVKEK